MGDLWQVYAIKYAERTGHRGGMFLRGDPHEAPMDMDYFIWVARNEERAVAPRRGEGRPAARIDGLRRVLVR